MIGIRALASYVPEGYRDNLAASKRFGQDAEYVRKNIGASRLALKSEQEETSDLGCRAVERLCESSALEMDAIDALVVVTQNPDGQGLPHTSAVVHGKLGLGTEVAAFDVSLGCSGYVYGLTILRGLMQEAGLSNGVLVTADPYSKVVDAEDRVTAMLFGDAATATWVSPEPVFGFGRPLLQTDGSKRENLEVVAGRLSMNGRQVFNFAQKEAVLQILRCLEGSALTAEDVDLYCVHQGSAAIVHAIARKFPTVSDRFILDMDATGNTVSSTIPLLLERHVMDSDAERVIISGFGVGLSWATNLLERIKE